MQLKGSFVALITPFTEDKKVDISALEELILWHIEEGTDGIVLCGTTGESPTLSHEEKLLIFETGVKIAKKEIPIIAGIGSYNTEESVILCRQAKDLNVDAALIIVPYYNRPTMEGCFLHYQALSEVGLPFILYHHPGRTGLKLSMETVEKISTLSHFLGIKECSSDLPFAIEMAQKIKKPILAGDDGLLLPMMASGATGIISVIANVIPKVWKELTQFLLNGQLKEAQMLFATYYPLIAAVGLETNPQPIKYALSLLGKCAASYRLPLIPPKDSVKEAIAKALFPMPNVDFAMGKEFNCHIGRCPCSE